MSHMTLVRQNGHQGPKLYIFTVGCVHFCCQWFRHCCWIILKGQQIYSVIQVGKWLLYIVAKCLFFFFCVCHDEIISNHIYKNVSVLRDAVSVALAEWHIAAGTVSGMMAVCWGYYLQPGFIVSLLMRLLGSVPLLSLSHKATVIMHMTELNCASFGTSLMI